LAFLSVGDAKSARPALVNASRRTGQNASLLSDVAQLQLRADDAAGAAYTLEKALQVQRDHPQALLLMASLELRSGQIDKADVRSKQLQASRPRSAATHLLAADVATARKDPSRALAALRKAHEVQPSTATLMRLFIHQVQNNAAASAISSAEAWLSKRPRDTAVRQALANQLAAMGQWRESRQQYERLLEQQPSNAAALNNLANVLLAQNDLKGALTAAERANKVLPDQALTLDTMGWVLHRMGQHDKALGLLREARIRAPDHAEVRYHLAAVMAHLGRKAEAKAELDAALANPVGLESVDAAKALANTLK
jgi:tetratricopeptide (TPR) repeat protein